MLHWLISISSTITSGEEKRSDYVGTQPTTQLDGELSTVKVEITNYFSQPRWLLLCIKKGIESRGDAVVAKDEPAGAPRRNERSTKFTSEKFVLRSCEALLSLAVSRSTLQRTSRRPCVRSHVGLAVRPFTVRGERPEPRTLKVAVLLIACLLRCAISIPSKGLLGPNINAKPSLPSNSFFPAFFSV